MDPERTKAMGRARTAIYRAIKKGVLIRPTACSACNSIAPIEAAHTDYTRPLEITWLCRTCHRLWDFKQPKTPRNP
jgi:hypothetical protein